MRSGGIFCGTWWVVLCLAPGCGGRADSGAGAPAGPLATCGDNCSQTQVAASCSSTCGKIVQAGCSFGTGDCATSCSNVVSVMPSCSSLALAFLRCLETNEPTCSAGMGSMVDFVGCDSAEQGLQSCLDSNVRPVVVSPVGSAGPAVGSAGPVPASVCPNIPRPVGGAGACAGGGGGSGSSGANAPTCDSTCQDSTGNTWQASCADSTCTCSYNGGSPCTCTQTGPPGTCSSCCPGAQ
jgi:hypothetical protein